MKEQEILKIIDEIIEKANEIRKLQGKIGASIIGDPRDVLVYDEEELLKYAEIVGEYVKEIGFISSNRKHGISFVYKGYEFCSYVSEDEFAQIREKVLPPTKVTEPNQNNE